VGGLWMVFIGWFLRNAAIVSYEQHLVRLALEGVPAWQIMSRDPETVQPDLTLQALVDDYFLRRRYQAFPVSTDGTPLGIITMHQVKDVPREEWPQRTVAETMTPADETVTVRPEESMVRVLERMEQSGTRRVLVTRNGQLVGIITAADISDWLRRAREFERI